jgi:hypothetical protein
MIPRKPTTIALRAEDIQDLHEQIAEREAMRSSTSKQGESSSAATEKPTGESNAATSAAQPVSGPSTGVPETTLDARKGKTRNERLGL